MAKTIIRTAMDFGAVVKARRKELGFRQVDVAMTVPCSRRLVRELEHGKPTIQLEKAIAVAQILGVDLFLVDRGNPR